MVNQHHALSEKKAEKIIGVLVKNFFLYLVKVEVA